MYYNEQQQNDYIRRAMSDVRVFECTPVNYIAVH